MTERVGLIVCCALTACGGARGGGATENRAAPGGACLPAGDAYRLVNAGGRSHVCSERGGGDDGGPVERACWVVDLGSGTLQRSDLVDEPGRGRTVPATWTALGLCADGYCIPGERPGDDGAGDEPPSLQLATGAGVAAVVGSAGGGEQGVYLFDAARRPRPLTGTDREDGPSASAADPWIVGDVVFVGDFDAGPHADVHAYAADGTLLGPVAAPADGGDFELYNGMISPLSDHEVAFIEHRLTRVLVFDTRTRTTTEWTRRTTTPAGCTAAQRDVFFDPVDASLDFALEDGSMSKACLAALQAAEGRFAPRGVARTAGGALVALARAAGGTGLALVHFDAAGGVAHEVTLATCGP